MKSLWKIANWPIMEKRFNDALSQSAAAKAEDTYHSDIPSAVDASKQASQPVSKPKITIMIQITDKK